MVKDDEGQKGDKKERLTAAAKALFHRQGVQDTTLADIAQEAGVPLGNVYYHFRTKESLVEAVIAAHLREIEADYAVWEVDPDPRRRLVSFIRAGESIAEQIGQFGCPRGSLSHELGKGDQVPAEKAEAIFRCQLRWVERQFRLLGKGDEAADLATDLMAALQGASLLANSLHEPDILLRQMGRLEAWLADVA